MPIVKFRGRVLPATVQVSAKTPALKWSNTETGLAADILVVIENSAVEVLLDLNRPPTSEEFPRLFFWAFDMARAPVDLIAFSKATGLTVILETFIDATGNAQPIQANDPGLAGLCTAFGEDDAAGFDAVWRIVATTPEIFMALNDLIVALSLPHYGPRVSGQVVETIRRHLAPQGLEPKQQWPHMQRLLNAERGYLQYVSDNATGPRHGDRAYIPPDVTRELAVRTWTLMNRFLEFKKRGGANPLPQADFPVLR